MSRRNAYSNQIIALALFHRYGWLIVMLTFMQFFPSLYIASAFFLAFAVWSFTGYKRKWKHIYCSYQNAYHKPMNPSMICWDSVKKTDVYGVSLLFFFLGIVALLLATGCIAQ